MTNLTIALVLAAGTVDRKASTAAFESAVDKYIAESETEQSTIATAVGAVFDAHKGDALKMPILAAFTCQELNAQRENYSTLDERVRTYVRTNSEGDSSLFVISKGKGGGVRRRADMPAATVSE